MWPSTKKKKTAEKQRKTASSSVYLVFCPLTTHLPVWLLYPPPYIGRTRLTISNWRVSKLRSRMGSQAPLYPWSPDLYLRVLPSAVTSILHNCSRTEIGSKERAKTSWCWICESMPISLKGLTSLLYALSTGCLKESATPS